MSQQQEFVWRPRVIESTPAPAGGVPRLIWELLSARGLDTPEAVQRWLSPSLRELRPPFALKEMDKAVERLLQAFEREEKICIYCDYDLDGTSACAMLKTAFEAFGFRHVTHYQPKRLTEGYGLHKEAIAKIAAQGVTLILTADLGITAIEEVDYARELNVDVIVTDHHLPKEQLPRAVAVVNPNRSDCIAELGHLCGTGVAFYLVLALRRALLEQDLLKSEFDPKSLLDCFVIGTLTDMVPLIEENRILVKHGLLVLAQTRRPGLRALLQALKLWGIPLTSQDVAIRFAPKLNALSRMETGVQPLDLFLASNMEEAEKLVVEVLSNNQMRQALQRDAEKEALRQMKENPPSSCCFVYSPEFHRGVVGLVATRLAQEFGLPAFVGSVDEHGCIVGSGRMPSGVPLSLLDALQSCEGLLTQFGGHAMACGFELEEGKVSLVKEALDVWFAEQTTSVKTKSIEWLYDAEATLPELNPDFMSWYERVSPFGAHFEAPVFLLRDVPVTQVQALRGGHLRLTVGVPSRNSRAALWFSPPKGHSVAAALADFKPSIGCSEVLVDALVEPQWNYFAGRKSLQLLIQGIRFSRPSLEQ